MAKSSDYLMEIAKTADILHVGALTDAAELLDKLENALKNILWKLERKVEAPALVGYEITWAKIDKNDATIRAAQQIINEIK